MKRATIYDFKRMCKNITRCEICPLAAFRNTSNSCFEEMIDNTEKVNEIILNWCKEHPVKTRQDKFLEIFPGACMRNNIIDIKPCSIYENFVCIENCEECRKDYWLKEME